jgi:hypothetical protein
MMKALLIDVDGLLPNLALMKLSAFHRRQGDETFLLRLTHYWYKHRVGKPIDMRINTMAGRPDRAYISCIFSKNRDNALSMKVLLESMGVPVDVGGVGVDITKTLPDDVEHIMPDYSLYPGLDYSLGYTSRGCLRKCPWCIVWRKEGLVQEWASLSEFLSPKHEKVILLDNNLLAAPNWEQVLLELIRRRLKVCFTQGLDPRLVTDSNARLLSICKYRNYNWTHRRLYFSFDVLEEEDAVLRTIKVLRGHDVPPKRLLFYVLVGYGKRPEEYTYAYFLEHDYHRFEVLRDQGTLPYIMVYNKRRDVPLLGAFQRWVNGHWYNSKPLLDYVQHTSPKIYASLQR